MRLVTFIDPISAQPRPGALIDQVVLDLVGAGVWPRTLPGTMEALVAAGPTTWEGLRRVVSRAEITPELLTKRNILGHPLAYAREAVRLLAPMQPRSLRDAYAFEQHVRTSHANRGRQVPEEWYHFPVFYFSNPNTIYAPDEALPYPRYTQALDYELEIAAIVGLPGKNLTPEQATEHIFGFTIFNDWSARDVQRQEMKAGLGPAKGKDFASSLGPCIVTVDELAERATGRPGVFDLAMSARVNGELRSQGNMKELYWSFGEIIARASAEVQLYPGEVIGSGTVGTGCLLELTGGAGPWLRPGDIVELEIEAIGVLRTPIKE